MIWHILIWLSVVDYCFSNLPPAVKADVDVWMPDCVEQRRCHHVLMTRLQEPLETKQSGRFQHGLTKSDNTAKCHSNQSSEVSSQQPIRSTLIKREQEKQQRPSVLPWHGPAWQCPEWIFCGASVKSGVAVNSYTSCAQRSSIKWKYARGVFNALLMFFYLCRTSDLIWNCYYSMLCKWGKLEK